MAGDWMKIELELPDKPEVHSIASMLNIDPDAVVGKLIRIWQWFDKHTTDGNAFGVTYSLPDRISGVSGFAEAMVFVGWLEQNDKTLTMPKFDRHTSNSAKTRAQTQKRVAKLRNADAVTESLPEKRREEKKKDTKPTSSKSAISINTFLENCDKAGEKRIPETDPVFDFAEKAGIPIEMIKVCWNHFVKTHSQNGKRQKNWRQTFGNCVKGNWYKLWYVEADGTVKETSQYRALKKGLDNV